MSRVAKSLVRSRRSTTSCDDRLERVAVGGAPRRGEAQVAQAHRRALRVDDLHRACRSTAAAAATWADCIVADRCDERLMHTMPVAPRAGEVAEASPRTRRPTAPPSRGGASECSRRCQNSSVLELLAVDELLVAEADGERHDLDAERVDERLRQIAALSVTTRMLTAVLLIGPDATADRCTRRPRHERRPEAPRELGVEAAIDAARQQRRGRRRPRRAPPSDDRRERLAGASTSRSRSPTSPARPADDRARRPTTFTMVVASAASVDAVEPAVDSTTSVSTAAHEVGEREREREARDAEPRVERRTRARC